MPYDYYTNQPAEWGLAKVASLIAQERAKNPNLLLIDGGDTIQGTPLTYYYNRIDTEAVHPMAVTMNALKFDAATLGNHEFDYGTNVLSRWISQLNFPIVCANIQKSDGTPAFKPYIIKNVDGIKIGILGLITPATYNWVPSENIAGLTFENLINTAQKYIPQMRNDGADLITIVQHTGFSKVPKDKRLASAWLTDIQEWKETGSIPDSNLTLELAQQVKDIDIIMAGHSHHDVPKAIVNNVLIAEPSFWGKALSKYTLVLEYRGKKWEVITKNSTNLYVTAIEPEQKILQLYLPYHQQILRYINQPIGVAKTEFYGGIKARFNQSKLSILINQVQIQAAKAAGYPVNISLTSIFNNTGKIPPGKITRRDIYSIYNYDNYLLVLEINGDILRCALEKNAAYFKQVNIDDLPDYPEEVLVENSLGYNWDLYSGIDYIVDITQPVGKRITKLQLDGKDVEANQVLRVAMNSYRANGGGGYFMFKEGKIICQSVTEIRELIAEYIRNKSIIESDIISSGGLKLFPDLYQQYFGN
ncbi:bifunctional metallophosphatase/5'-nucleotidase [Okeania hirsuta]|uniref:Bifunctional metallophosphatase/5'-nucleotidase n=2 Tax=Microcoleaceae TaxID=1892252 RepID=A0A3N6P8W1_9CYAN|nr:bifunctional metallophosphatase/5'-nucleotidase [Okeania sp. SIO2B9]RQH38022.1 bifunctional metallophosphatase/5'-nucleotidase [Okeania hirsuta]